MPRKAYVRGLRPHRRGELPRLAVVKAAVETACLITGAKVFEVMFPSKSFMHEAHRSPEVMARSRARAYAAFALRAIFEDGQPAKIAAMVGAVQHYQYFAGKDNDMKTGRLTWWNDAAFMRVIEATEAFIAMEDGKKMEAVG